MRFPYVFLTAAVIGALSSIGFSPFDTAGHWALWPLPLLAAVLVWKCIFSVLTVTRALVVGYAYGIGLLLAGMYWLSVAMVYGTALTWPIAIALTVVVSMIAAVPYAIVAAIAHRIVRRDSAFDMLLLLPTLWIFAEIIRAFFLPRLPWLLTAHALVPSPLIVFAPVTGEWGLAFAGLAHG